MKEALSKEVVVRRGGILNKIIIIDRQLIFSHGLAITLNAGECIILRAQHHDVQQMLAEIFTTVCDGVFIGCIGAADLLFIHEIAAALRRRSIPLFLMIDKTQNYGPMAYVPSGVVLISRNETPEKIRHEVNRTLGQQRPLIQVADNRVAVTHQSKLSPQEKRVLREILKGYSLTDTALRLNKSVKTVSTQKQNAIRRLGLKNSLELYQLLMTPGCPYLTD